METKKTTLTLDKKITKFTQEVTSTFLFYVHIFNSTMFKALSAIIVEQVNPTEKVLLKTNQFLDYTATIDEAIITYGASNIILAIHSDASYLSESKARSRIGGHFFMSAYTAFPPNNSMIPNMVQIIKQVISSAAKTKLGALYINSKLATQMQ